MKERKLISVSETSTWTKGDKTCRIHSAKGIIDEKLDKNAIFNFSGYNPFPCFDMVSTFAVVSKWLIDNGWERKLGATKVMEYAITNSKTGEMISKEREIYHYVAVAIPAKTETKANEEKEDFSLPKEWVPGLEKTLKEKYLDAACVKEGTQVFTYKMLSALKEMAKADVYPDGRFSDIECDVWSLFR